MKQRGLDYYDTLRKRDWVSVTDIGPSARSRYRIIRRLLKRYRRQRHRQGLRVLDCGCGTGSLMKLLRNSGYIISGSDFSAEAVRIAKQQLGPRPDIFTADLTQRQSFGRRRYDAIVCSEVLEHIEDDETAHHFQEPFMQWLVEAELALEVLDEFRIQSLRAAIAAICGRRRSCRRRVAA